MKIIITSISILLFISFTTSPINAITDPTATPNNPYGIHIVNENDLEDSKNLLNSQGGEWGYIKLVIQEDDRSYQKWQAIFDKCRELKLIPIVRLATKGNGAVWEKPGVTDAEDWAIFLNSLNWVVKNRYVVIFNEPNHGNEWGGEANPDEYAEILKVFAEKLKLANEDFFILNAGLDASAPNEPPRYMDEVQFIERLVSKEPTILNHLDGWTSHSYPNPNFSGSATDTGRKSIRTFEWEQAQLKKYTSKDLPVFILETGWNNETLSEDKITDYYKTAFQSVWNSKKIIAITPFLLNYQAEPFLKFSWKKQNTSEFYKHFYAIKELPKIKGEPLQIHKAQVLEKLPEELVQNSNYLLKLTLTNNGQSVWDKTDSFELEFESSIKINQETAFSKVLPGKQVDIVVMVQTPNENALYDLNVYLTKDKTRVVPIFNQKIQTISPLNLNLTVRPLIKKDNTGTNFILKILDGESEVINFQNVHVDNGVAVIPNIHNLLPNTKYTFELQKDYYLRKRITLELDQDQTTLEYGIIYPLDQNNNKNFDILDLFNLLKHPIRFIKGLFSFGV